MRMLWTKLKTLFSRLGELLDEGEEYHENLLYRRYDDE